ncbi:MAG: LAGLIDADG family homing endonuclease [Promethearchaeota archaeon]
MKRIYAEQDTWKKVYSDLKERGYTLLKIREEIGTQIERQLYKGYGINIESFKKLQELVGYQIPTISNPFWEERFDFDLNNETAELIGILLGDGGISRKVITISIHSQAKEYIEWVRKLVKSVFKYDVKFHKRKNKKVIDLKIHSVARVEALLHLGLKTGNKVKKQVGVPDWIKADDNYFISCIRGLIDTDGYIGRYQKRDNRYTWHQYNVGFGNHSVRLVDDFVEFCNRFNIPVSRSHKYKAIIGSKKGVLQFLELTMPFKLTQVKFTLDELR